MDDRAHQECPTLIRDNLRFLIILLIVRILLLAIFTFSLAQKSYWAERDELQTAVSGGTRILGEDLKARGGKVFIYEREINCFKENLVLNLSQLNDNPWTCVI